MKNKEQLLRSYNKQVEIYNQSRDQRVKRLKEHINLIEIKLEKLQKELEKNKNSLNDNLQTSFISFEDYCKRASLQSTDSTEGTSKKPTDKMNLFDSNDDDDEIIKNPN